MFGKTLLALGLAAGFATAGAAPSQAAMLATTPLPASPLVQQAQFFFNPLDLVFGGHEWCWYDDGWRGDGWYWCGYGEREGYGWGGGEGFNGWREHRYERDWHGGGGERRHHDGGGERHFGGGDGDGGGMRRHHEGGGGGERHGGGGGGGGQHHGSGDDRGIGGVPNKPRM